MTIFTPRPQWIVDLINELAGEARGVWLQTALDAKVGAATANRGAGITYRLVG